MGATTYLVPPLAILLAWLVLDEAPATMAFAGGALCLVGVALSRRGPRRSAAPPAEVPPPTLASRSADSAEVDD